MRESVRIFLEHAVGAFDLRGPVCEFIFAGEDQATSGLPLGELFGTGRYTTCELTEEGVAQYQAQPARLPMADASLRTALCLNVLEHVWDPQPVVAEIDRVLMPGGIIVVASSTDDGAAPSDVGAQPLQPRLLRELLSGLEATLVGWQGAADDPHTVFGLGLKAPIAAPVAEGIRRFLEQLPAELGRLRHRRPWRFQVRKAMALCRGAGHEYRHWRDYFAAQFMFDLTGHCRWEPAGGHWPVAGGQGSEVRG
jgi:SAM-dependent methyltransferase